MAFFVPFFRPFPGFLLSFFPLGTFRGFRPSLSFIVAATSKVWAHHLQLIRAGTGDLSRKMAGGGGGEVYYCSGPNQEQAGTVPTCNAGTLWSWDVGFHVQGVSNPDEFGQNAPKCLVQNPDGFGRIQRAQMSNPDEDPLILCAIAVSTTPAPSRPRRAPTTRMASIDLSADPPLFDPGRYIRQNKKFSASDVLPEVHTALAELLKLPQSLGPLFPLVVQCSS
ncbi:hypothetical protein B0H17DRAFT_1186562 [Mycena rosella]|uniref:Uncharacterized protein n=1 Tax=Mycena rosella TaxID=1033263 RepID=A0AAD7G3L5_MYCRO|nr:hypothetical protein B0H17DRAFT_1186562 [Mycena rosella]